MRVPCSSWARGFLRWRGTTADHLVVRSGTAATDGRRGQPCARNPRPAARARSTHQTPSRPNAHENTQQPSRCQGEGRGFESRRPLKSPAQRRFRGRHRPGKASPSKGEGREAPWPSASAKDPPTWAFRLAWHDAHALPPCEEPHGTHLCRIVARHRCARSGRDDRDDDVVLSRPSVWIVVARDLPKARVCQRPQRRPPCCAHRGRPRHVLPGSGTDG
jgi:hypothetical protein